MFSVFEQKGCNGIFHTLSLSHWTDYISDYIYSEHAIIPSLALGIRQMALISCWLCPWRIFSQTIWHSCQTGHFPSKADLKLKGPSGFSWDTFGCAMHYWYLCIALDLAVQFKLLSGVCVWTHFWVYVQLGSSADIAPIEQMTSIDQQASSLGLGPTFPPQPPL